MAIMRRDQASQANVPRGRRAAPPTSSLESLDQRVAFGPERLDGAADPRRRGFLDLRVGEAATPLLGRLGLALPDPRSQLLEGDAALPGQRPQDLVLLAQPGLLGELLQGL